jgi:hypothetical protein
LSFSADRFDRPISERNKQPALQNDNLQEGSDLKDKIAKRLDEVLATGVKQTKADAESKSDAGEPQQPPIQPKSSQAIQNTQIETSMAPSDPDGPMPNRESIGRLLEAAKRAAAQAAANPQPAPPVQPKSGQAQSPTGDVQPLVAASTVEPISVKPEKELSVASQEIVAGSTQSEALNKKIEAVKKKIEALKSGSDPAALSQASLAALPAVKEGSKPPSSSTSAKDRLLEAAQRAADLSSTRATKVESPQSRTDASQAIAPSPDMVAQDKPGLTSSDSDAGRLAQQLVSQAYKKTKGQLSGSQDSLTPQGFKNIEAAIRGERARASKEIAPNKRERARVRDSFAKPRFGSILIILILIGCLGLGVYYGGPIILGRFAPQAPAAHEPDVPVDALIDANKLEEARAALESHQKGPKFSQEDAKRYIKISKKYADFQQYEEAVEVLQKFSRRSPYYQQAKKLLKLYKSKMALPMK